jgi:Xaa-Pro aminopeptidase
MKLCDATALVQGLRMVKSGAEIAKIAHICEIASKTFAGVPEIIRPGLPRDALFRAFRGLALSFGADEVPYLVGGAGQGGYSDVISPPVSTPLAAGDLVMLDTGMTWDGYFCDFDRNWSLGPPDGEVVGAYDKLREATEAGLAAALAGATTRELFTAMNKVLGQGEGAIGRMGHGLGMQLTEQPSIMAGGDVTLAPGMVLTLEPSVAIADGRMMVTEENIVVTDGAPLLLSRRAPAELPWISL